MRNKKSVVGTRHDVSCLVSSPVVRLVYYSYDMALYSVVVPNCNSYFSILKKVLTKPSRPRKKGYRDSGKTERVNC